MTHLQCLQSDQQFEELRHAVSGYIHDVQVVTQLLLQDGIATAVDAAVSRATLLHLLLLSSSNQPSDAMKRNLQPDALQGFTLLHHIGMDGMSWGMSRHVIQTDYSQGIVSQVIQQLLEKGVDINAKDIKVCATCNPKHTES